MAEETEIDSPGFPVRLLADAGQRVKKNLFVYKCEAVSKGSYYREFAKTIKRPFGLRYNPYTQTVDLLTNTRKIANIVSELKGDLCIVTNALSKLKVSESEAPNR